MEVRGRQATVDPKTVWKYKPNMMCTFLALLKAQISLQLGKVFSSDNGVSVSIMYSYTYWLYS